MRARLRARGRERPPGGSARPGKDPAAIPACCAWIWLRTSQAGRVRGRAAEGCQALWWKEGERKAGSQNFLRILVQGACASTRAASSSCKRSGTAGRMLTATMHQGCGL